ncbi:MAG: beta-eliminating lyase-related protein [Gammaproteobacteria bacterium]|nr:beta-eliminating lyase-related protein [Gammaproteobacteria bacterium]
MLTGSDVLADLLKQDDASASEGFDFYSDNAAGVHPRILEALVACNRGFVPPYGMERFTRRIDSAFSEVFERACFVFPVPTGTAANGLALGALAPPHGLIFAHCNAHIVTTECGAPEFFTLGARLALLEGPHNKLAASTFESALHGHARRTVHQLLPAAVSLTQATERGTVYALEEIAAISGLAHAAGLKVHMDGARFANAMVSLDATPAEMSWKAGVDAVSFGATKNGTMNADAVVLFDAELAEKARFIHKRAGFLHSKMRFMSAQLLAYLEDGLWVANARAANANAERLAAALASVKGVELNDPVQANELFPRLPADFQRRLKSESIHLRDWPDAKGNLFRIVTSYCDGEARIGAFEKVCREFGGGEANATRSGE